MLLRNIRDHLASEAFGQQCKGALYVTFLIYCLYQAVIFLSWTAMSPDEISFIAGSKVYLFANRSAPPLNYGTLFWALLALLKTPLISRVFFLCLFIAVPFLLLRSIHQAPIRLLAFLFYLSLPYAFWTGKLISPEILILFLIALSLFFFSQGKTGLASLVGGLAIGIKLTAAPYGLFLIFLALHKHRLNRMASYLLLACIGIWLANPINFDLYFANLLASSVNSVNLYSINLERVQEILFLPSWSWDMILTNSFSQLICNPYCVAAVILATTIQNRRLGLGLLIASACSFTLVYFSKDTFAWYFFPLVPMLVFSIGALSPHLPRITPDNLLKIEILKPAQLLQTIFPIVIVLLVTLFNLYSNTQYSIYQAAEKFSQIQSRRNYPSACIAQAIQNYQPQLIVNKTDREIDFQVIPKDAIVRGAYGSSIDINIRSMAIINTRYLKNLYHLDTLVYQNQSIKKYQVCNDVIIFTSQ